MRWPVKRCDWRRSFAWLPVKIGDEWIWLERYESRPMGEYREVRAALSRPNDGGMS